MSVAEKAMGWAKINRRVVVLLALVVVTALSGVAMTVRQVFAAHNSYAYVPILGNDPANPPPIPNDGKGDASNSAVYPGQVLRFDVITKNEGVVEGPWGRDQAKVFYLDPSPNAPYNPQFYYITGACGGPCYNAPDETVPPQPPVNYATNEGILYNPVFTNFNVPPIPAGGTHVGPPNSALAGSRSFAFTVPADAPAGRKICFFVHVNPGNPDNILVDGGFPDSGFGSHCYVVQHVGSAACDGIALDPSIVDPATSFRVTGRVRYATASAAAHVLATSGTRFYVNIVGPGVNRSYPNVTPITANGAILSATTSLQAPTGQTGVYTVTYGIAGSVGAVNCSTTFTVTKRPYFQVNGGDVSAGAGMSVGGNECAAAGGIAASQNASIVSWNLGSVGGYGGAGTKFGALALNRLQGFATGQGSGYAPTGLAFANTGGGAGHVNVAQQLFGGKFGSAACTADFWARATNVIQGNTTIGGRTVANGSHETIYVNGDVYITGNIIFSGNYVNVEAIPSFAIVARGNIYVDRSVTRLDGFYIAEPTSIAAGNGTFRACATGAFVAAPLNRNLQSVCDTPLVVNGGVVARQVWLTRTAGTMSGSPAETFNYSPEFWLSAPYGGGVGPVKGSGYDSITSLPPVL